MGGGAQYARTGLELYLRLLQYLEVYILFMTYPYYLCTSYWSKLLNVLRGVPPFCPIEKMLSVRMFAKKTELKRWKTDQVIEI